jgi:hypothetical protein
MVLGRNVRDERNCFALFKRIIKAIGDEQKSMSSDERRNI